MALEVVTNDASSLSAADLDEMAAIEGAFDIDAIAEAQEQWVLATTARVDGKLHGFTFSTLERIGGTPCVLLGMMSIRRSSKRDTILRGLMGEAYHRALMAFPDEDVVVGSRFVDPTALKAFDKLDDVTPAPGQRAVGEERAWGRRLAKRFGVDANYDAKTFTSTNTDGPHLDYASTTDPDPDIAEMMSALKADNGDVMVVYGWSMAEDLAKIGKR